MGCCPITTSPFLEWAICPMEQFMGLLNGLSRVNFYQYDNNSKGTKIFTKNFIIGQSSKLLLVVDNKMILGPNNN